MEVTPFYLLDIEIFIGLCRRILSGLGVAINCVFEQKLQAVSKVRNQHSNFASEKKED
jgi:hypothetical protein